MAYYFRKISLCSQPHAVLRHIFSYNLEFSIKVGSWFLWCVAILYLLLAGGNVYFNQNFLVNSLSCRRKNKVWIQKGFFIKLRSCPTQLLFWQAIDYMLMVKYVNTDKILIWKSFEHIDWIFARILKRCISQEY